ARKLELAQQAGVNFEGALTWAFEFEGQPYFAGFRSLASNGLDKPVLNVFRMFSRMGAKRVLAETDHAMPLATILSEGVRGEPDVSTLASIEQNKLCVLVWHYHDDDVPGPPAALEMSIRGLPTQNSAAKLRHFRIDNQHSNAFAAWERLG